MHRAMTTQSEDRTNLAGKLGMTLTERHIGPECCRDLKGGWRVRVPLNN